MVFRPVRHLQHPAALKEKTMKSETNKFHNYIKQTWHADATETRNGRWYIMLGFAGFNTSANNCNGYSSKESAEAVILQHQNK